MPWSDVVAYVVMMLTDCFILAGTVYLIGWCGWSAWWMLLAVILVGGTRFRERKNDAVN